MLGGTLGTVRVGMDRAIIDAAAAQTGWFLFGVFGGVAVVAVLCGVLFARRLTQPLTQIVRAAEREEAKARAELALYEQIAKENAGEVDRERREIKQFVYTLRDQKQDRK